MSQRKLCGEESGKNEATDKCKCGNFKEFEHELCKECYKKYGRINDHSIKGRLAEAIIEEMFLAMDYRVFRFGMENTVPGFSERHLPKTGEVANEVRKMPDFIVVKDKHIAYLEVKYRTSGKFDLEKYYKKRGGYPYSSAYIVLVTPKHIKIQKASELEKGEGFIFLNKCKDFETDKKIILQYIKFCNKFFGNC